MKQIPNPSRKRLVTLSQILAQIKNKVKITSVEISEITGWSEATIRRDISLLELHSGKSNGYIIEELKNSICDILNLSSGDSNIKKCCVIGLGKIGMALLDKSDLSNTNFKICAGFDSSTNRVEILSSRIPLYSTLRIEYVIKNDGIDFAILAVADSDAQKITDRLVSVGVKGIANYTNTILKVPEDVVVENLSLSMALSNISTKLNCE